MDSAAYYNVELNKASTSISKKKRTYYTDTNQFPFWICSQQQFSRYQARDLNLHHIIVNLFSDYG